MSVARIFGPGPSQPSHYRYTLELCQQSWAWEFLRRSEPYQSTFEATTRRARALRRIGTRTYFRRLREIDAEAEAFGLCSFRPA